MLTGDRKYGSSLGSPIATQVHDKDRNVFLTEFLTESIAALLCTPDETIDQIRRKRTEDDEQNTITGMASDALNSKVLSINAESEQPCPSLKLKSNGLTRVMIRSHFC